MQIDFFYPYRPRLTRLPFSPRQTVPQKLGENAGLGQQTIDAAQHDLVKGHGHDGDPQADGRGDQRRADSAGQVDGPGRRPLRDDRLEGRDQAVDGSQQSEQRRQLGDQPDVAQPGVHLDAFQRPELLHRGRRFLVAGGQLRQPGGQHAGQHG